MQRLSPQAAEAAATASLLRALRTTAAHAGGDALAVYETYADCLQQQAARVSRHIRRLSSASNAPVLITVTPRCADARHFDFETPPVLAPLDKAPLQILEALAERATEGEHAAVIARAMLRLTMSEDQVRACALVILLVLPASPDTRRAGWMLPVIVPRDRYGWAFDPKAGGTA